MNDKNLTKENLELKLQLLATQAQLLQTQDILVRSQYQQIEDELKSLATCEEASDE